MWKLTIEDDEGNKTFVSLLHEEYHVGRGEENAVRLTERNISRHHATLKRTRPNSWHLIDHKSYNGCFVNGQRVAGGVALGHTDLLQLGDYRIFLHNEELQSRTSSSPSGVPVAPSTEFPDRLLVLAGPIPGIELRIDEGQVTIGRADECAFPIQHPSVSRIHALVQSVGKGRYEIIDQGSANGVLINGTELKHALLEAGDLIELGDVKLRFLERGQAPRAGVDASQQLPSVSDQVTPSTQTPRPLPKRRTTSQPPPSTPKKKPVKKAWFIVVPLLLIGAGASYAYRSYLSSTLVASRSPHAASSTSATITPDTASDIFAGIRRALDAGDTTAAAKMLDDIGTTSPLRHSPEYTALLSAWADATFHRVDRAADTTQKRIFLGQIAQNAWVDRDRRKRASDLLTALDAPTGTDVMRLPSASLATTASVHGTNGPGPSRLRTATEEPIDPPTRSMGSASRDVAETNKNAAATRGEHDHESGRATNPETVFKSDGESALRRSLEGRVWSGKATNDEIKMLKAICQHQNDTTCRDRAAVLLKN